MSGGLTVSGLTIRNTLKILSGLIIAFLGPAHIRLSFNRALDPLD